MEIVQPVRLGIRLYFAGSPDESAVSSVFGWCFRVTGGRELWWMEGAFAWEYLSMTVPGKCHERWQVRCIAWRFFFLSFQEGKDVWISYERATEEEVSKQ